MTLSDHIIAAGIATAAAFGLVYLGLLMVGLV